MAGRPYKRPEVETMLLFAPLYAPLLLAFIPKRLRGLRIAVMVIGIACNILMVIAAFYYGITRKKKGRWYSFVSGASIDADAEGETTGLPLDEELADAEMDWDRDSGVL